MSKLKSVIVVDHPVVARDLTILRNKETPSSVFRPVLGRLATILAYHALDHLPLKSVSVETPMQMTTGYTIDTEITVVPILRAGLGLVDAITQFIPEARIGHLGLYRDKVTHKPVEYYINLPSVGLKEGTILLVDPMLATGGSAIDAVGYLKKQGAKTIRFMCLIAAPEGVEALHQEHPDVPIITASIDEKLNENAYIIPGLGDAGDRIFGTS
jgi:uracil phosphoribosyltransferase